MADCGGRAEGSAVANRRDPHEVLGGEINLVMGVEGMAAAAEGNDLPLPMVQVFVDENLVQTFTIDRFDLFALWKGEYGEHEVTLKIAGAGPKDMRLRLGSKKPVNRRAFAGYFLTRRSTCRTPGVGRIPPSATSARFSFDVGSDEGLGEDTVFREEGVVVFQRVECVGECCRCMRDLAEFACLHLVEVFVGVRSGLELALDAVETG